MRTPISRIERIAGLFILLGLLILGALALFPGIMSGRLFGHYEFLVVAEDGIGLSVGDKIKMKNIQIGYVSGLKMNEANEVIIGCAVYRGFRDKITTGIDVRLVPPDILGSPIVRLQPGDGDPLDPDTLIRARIETTITDKIGELARDLSGDFRRVFDKVENRIEQVGENLAGFQRILDAVNSGEGFAGKLIHEKDLYADVRRILGRVDETLAGVERIRGRVEEFSEILPSLKTDLAASSEKLRASLGHVEEALADVRTSLPGLREDLSASSTLLRSSLARVEEGMERFPGIATDTAFALEEARRILESVKRNFLIRGNLPREAAAESMAPASYRAPGAKETRSSEAEEE